MFHTDTLQPATQPTRLLQIGQPIAGKIRLLADLKQIKTGFQYATLSHCWGSSNPLQLTSASFHSLQQGITISELGQTFQDAIFIAQSLEIEFVWIDSLCILQDSEEDWLREAPLMSNVYKNARLNIATSVAADTNAGCFLDRDPFLIQPCTIQTTWKDHENDTYDLYYGNFWDESFLKIPLMKRAWVVQELILAQRVLYITNAQFFWECCSLTACESYQTVYHLT